MKRRSFFQAVGGAIAAVFVPVVAAKTKPIGRFYALEENEVVTWAESNEPEFWDYHPPETVAELRAAIESRYETVHEFKHGVYEEEPRMSGFGAAATAKSAQYNGPIYKGYVIAGEGASEKEAVADAFNNITWGDIGGKEMMWRVAPQLTRFRCFSTNFSGTRVRARLLVLR